MLRSDRPSTGPFPGRLTTKDLYVWRKFTTGPTEGRPRLAYHDIRRVAASTLQRFGIRDLDAEATQADIGAL